MVVLGGRAISYGRSTPVLGRGALPTADPIPGRPSESLTARVCVRVWGVIEPIRKRTPPGPCRTPVPRVLGRSLGGGRFLVGEVPL